MDRLTQAIERLDRKRARINRISGESILPPRNTEVRWACRKCWRIWSESDLAEQGIFDPSDCPVCKTPLDEVSG